MSEISASKVSWATDLSPTAIFLSAAAAHDGCMLSAVAGGVPGVGRTGGAGRAIPGTPRAPSRTHI